MELNQFEKAGIEKKHHAYSLFMFIVKTWLSI